MPTLMQKIRLALRGWNRRREEKNREFLARNISAAPPSRAAIAAEDRGGTPSIDIDGLTIAYLDGSGRTTYYLDAQSGEVIESNAALDAVRYKPIPTAAPEADRMAFIATVKDAANRARLAPPASFREVLSRDRALERAWFNFRNDRALDAIRRWLRENGLQ